VKGGQFEIGDRLTVYREVRRQTEVCSHGVSHEVPMLEVKRLTVDHIARENVPFLLYTEDAIGTVLYAVDAQRRIYRKVPHWDGPRATSWMRIHPLIERDRGFTQYPRPVFSRDVFGRPLWLGGCPTPIVPESRRYCIHHRHLPGRGEYHDESRWCPSCQSYEMVCADDHCLECGAAT
jgi:hypothetical protein